VRKIKLQKKKHKNIYFPNRFRGQKLRYLRSDRAKSITMIRLYHSQIENV